MNIAQWLKLIPVTSFTSKKREKSTSFAGALFGLEIELENTRNIQKLFEFQSKEDGSLRNNGREYVSQPWPFEWLVESLQSFYTVNKISNNNVSERCSVHVHLNCQELSLPQLQTFIKLYQVLERLLFTWIGDERSQSIFCVPLSETLINYKLLQQDQALFLQQIQRWQKYTAFNLLPLLTYGTVEFRHMAGQSSPEKIINWLTIIGSMYEFVVKRAAPDFDEFLLNLNSTSHYEQLLDQVFGQHSQLFADMPLQMLLEEGVLNMKFMLLNTTKKDSGSCLDSAKPPIRMATFRGLMQPQENTPQVGW